MNSRAGFVVGALAGILVSGPTALAQMTLQPTARPIVTADNEAWYQAGVPLMFGGLTYYPSGPIVHFNGNEMVRSGHFQGIPLYSRTTIEPYSFVFVPLAGGLMQPYERRRSGDLADSVGSVTPSFPVVRASEQRDLEYVPGAGLVQAPAPPSQLGVSVDRDAAEPLTGAPSTILGVGTAGTQTAAAGPIVTARRPEGLNAVFIEYDRRRYFADGPVVLFDARVFRKVGDYRGFPVYQRQGQDTTLYLPPRENSGTLAPYRAR
jgi:hypothetical protein